jgi:hypothetical protein
LRRRILAASPAKILAGTGMVNAKALPDRGSGPQLEDTIDALDGIHQDASSIPAGAKKT